MNNPDYLYEHLPSRFRRDDEGLFLKRFLSFFGETLDDYDFEYENFFAQINPQTARVAFVEFWLRELFGWGWFPKWFTANDKRRLYGNFAQHLARRGTANGIEEFFADFYITAKVHKSPLFYGEFCWGEERLFVEQPLLLILEIGAVAPPNYLEDCCVYADSFYGESFYGVSEPLYAITEIENLARFVQPQAQEIILRWRTSVFVVADTQADLPLYGDILYGETND